MEEVPGQENIIEQPERPLTPEEKAQRIQEAIAKEYEKLSQQAPAREVTVATAKPEDTKTLGEAMSTMEDLTDLQYAMAKLFPTAVDFNSTMVGRIDPHVFIPMLHLMSVDEIMRTDPDKHIDVNFIWLKNYILLSIGLDGRGRIDTAELLGAAREEKKAERLLRAGGI